MPAAMSLVAPEFAPTAQTPSQMPAIQNHATSVYEAASGGRQLARWRPLTVLPNDILGSLSTIRNRSREAARNNGYAKGLIDKLVTNLVGTGIKPLSQATDPEFRKTAQRLWAQWTDESDAAGLFDWYGLQSLIVRGWLEAGEIFIRLRPRLAADGLSVPLQLEVIEPELCPYTYSGQSAFGNRIRAGIEFDGIGRRIAYYFHPSRPELDDFNSAELRRVPAELVIHLYDPLRAGQLRGLPQLTQALVTLHELDKYDDAMLLKQQLSNLFVAFVKTPPESGEAEAIHPLTGKAVGSGDPPTLSLEPGIFQELQPGEEVVFSNPPAAPSGYSDFMRLQLRGIAVAVGVPYEVLTGDMTGMNDRTVRVVLNEFKRRIQMMQHQILAFKVCQPIWSAWMTRAFLSGALPIPAAYQTNPEPWAAVKWTPPRWAYLHPVQDVEADKAAIRAGFTSRADVVSEYGEDAEEIDGQQAEDNTRADDLGLRYDSDGRQPAAGPRSTFTEPGTPNEGDAPGAAPSGTVAASAQVPVVVHVPVPTSSGPLVTFGRPAMRLKTDYQYNDAGQIVSSIREELPADGEGALRIFPPAPVEPAATERT